MVMRATLHLKSVIVLDTFAVWGCLVGVTLTVVSLLPMIVGRSPPSLLTAADNSQGALTSRQQYLNRLLRNSSVPSRNRWAVGSAPRGSNKVFPHKHTHTKARHGVKRARLRKAE